MQKSTTVLLSIVGLLVLAVVVMYATRGFGPKAVPAQDKSTGTQTSNPPGKTPAPTQAPDWRVYKNGIFKYSISVTDAWSGYLTKRLETSPNTSGSIAFCVPTKDATYVASYCPAGYADVMIVTTYTAAQWAAVGEKTSRKLGQSGQYVVGVETWQDAPSDLVPLVDTFPKVFESFKAE
jgi:hypothetical protein